MEFNRIKCEVLVIGGGAAGLRAAIEASDCGTDVVLISKRKLYHGGATFYDLSLPWGLNASGNDENSNDIFLNEIVKASCGSLNKKLTEILVRDSNERFSDLLEYGMKFDLGDDTGEKPCFGEKPRGGQLIDLDNSKKCFAKQIKKRGIKVLDDIYIIDILVQDHTCHGAVGIDGNNRLTVINAKAVVLATGGAESLWEYNLVTSDVSGDGYAMAFKNGARLTNMEYIQFIPGTLQPIKKLNFFHPTLESLPEILDRNGNDMLARYLPEGVSIEQCLKERAGHGPFSYEDHSRYFEIAMCREEMDGDISGAEIVYNESYYSDKKYKLWDDFLISYGINTHKRNLTIYPHCHAFNGGIVIDEYCCTDIECLYACGECAGGPHGANRMGGNAILGTQVFGKIAGESAAKKSKTVNYYDLNDKDYLSAVGHFCDMGHPSKISPEDIIKKVKAIMQKSACIIRDEVNLQKGISSIEEMQGLFNLYEYFNNIKDLKKAVTANNYLITARAILYSMLNRRESRGSHYREDFPIKNGLYGDMIFIKAGNCNSITVERENFI